MPVGLTGLLDILSLVLNISEGSFVFFRDLSGLPLPLSFYLALFPSMCATC